MLRFWLLPAVLIACGGAPDTSSLSPQPGDDSGSGGGDTDSGESVVADPDDQDGDGERAEAAGGTDCNDGDDRVLGEDCAGRWSAPTETLTLAAVAEGEGLYLSDVQASYPDVDWSTLERLYIPAGHYKFIWLGNLPERDLADPLVITNLGGQVRVGGLGHYYNFVVSGGSGWVLTGRYDPVALTGDASVPGHRGNLYAGSRGRYGILIDDGFPEDEGDSGLGIGGGATGFEVEFLEITGVGFAGILMKTDDDGEATMKGCQLHDLYIHDTGSEGLYIGSTQSPPQHRIEGMAFYNNRVLRTGTELIQLGQLGPGNEIHHNVFALGALDWKAPFQQWQDNGAQIGVRYGDNEIHHNVFVGAAGSLLSWFGQARDGDDPQPGDRFHVYDNYFSHTRGLVAYLGGVDDGVSEWRFERNRFRAVSFQRDEVYDDSDYGHLFRVGGIEEATISFLDNTWEDGAGDLHSRSADPNTTVGNITGSGNTTVSAIAPYPFVDLGLDPAMDFLRVELWTEQATVGRQEAVSYTTGDIAIVAGVMYEALQDSSGAWPPEHPDSWRPLPLPADDVRVSRGSDHEGIGLLDTRP